jgi:hypothetical protein
MKQGTGKEVEVGEKNDDVVGANVRVSLGLAVGILNSGILNTGNSI